MSLNLKPYPLAKYLLRWYDQQGRKNLPWRQEINPYRVWVAEIMLQQTQVKTVIPYFERFISCFPTLTDLAQASEDQVLHLWTGLGYYARARNLHRTAKQILAQYGGHFPNSLEKIHSLPGIGRSTAGAILAIAFNQSAAILDGNVKRVLSRFYAVEGFYSPTQLTQQLWTLAEKHTPSKRTADYTQAIMDLGATVCTRTKPLCTVCPITLGCEAYLKNRVSEFPLSKASKTIPVRAINLLIFHNRKTNSVLLEKRPPVGIWGGLWSFPQCAIDKDIIKWCNENLNFVVLKTQPLTTFKHLFSHFQLNITPIYIASYQQKNRIMDSQLQVWYKLDKPTVRGFSTPVKQLLDNFNSMVLNEDIKNGA